jgi:phosphohistidine phosphatase
MIDPKRALTRAGREQVERVARRAAEKAVAVSAICHSGILRAQQTAEIFARHLAPDQGVKLLAGLRPNDDPAIMAAELTLAERPLLLVGHLPHMGRLASLLSGGNPDVHLMVFQPATLACLTRNGNIWQLAWSIDP